MAKTDCRTSNVIDFQAAKAARQARPFQGRLLKAVAAQMDPDTLAAVRKAVAAGYVNGQTTQDIARIIKRDAVRQAARAAL